ncbi:MAG: ArsR family transcriptional regulator [candidate division NC10 bacterium]|nr:ArsR family transcriptional regulator [candidate division NC10 bacterium]
MVEPTRINPAEVRAGLQSGRGTLLVCAYEDEAKFKRARLEGAISLQSLQSRLPSLPKETEIVFY